MYFCACTLKLRFFLICNVSGDLQKAQATQMCRNQVCAFSLKLHFLSSCAFSLKLHFLLAYFHFHGLQKSQGAHFFSQAALFLRVSAHFRTLALELPVCSTFFCLSSQVALALNPQPFGRSSEISSRGLMQKSSLYFPFPQLSFSSGTSSQAATCSAVFRSLRTPK